MDDITIRASQMPILDKCLGMLGAETKIDSISGAATLGTAVHAVCEHIVQYYDRPELLPYAEKYGVDGDDLGRLTWYALEAWRAFDGLFDQPETEVEMDTTFSAADADGANVHVRLTGHADVMAWNGDDLSVSVLDWKSGRKTDTNVYPQLMAYAWLAMQRNMMATHAVIIAVYLHDQTAKPWRISREQADAYMHQMFGAIADYDGAAFTAGDHCTFCPRRFECPARRQIIRSTVADLVNADAMAKITDPLAIPEAVVGLYQRVQFLECSIKAFRDQLRERIEADGPIEADGSMLSLQEQTLSQIDPVKAWPVLAAHLDDSELAPAVKLSKSKLESAVAAKAPRGHKGAAKQTLLEELADAGAITNTTRARLTLTKKEKNNDE